MGRDDPKAGKGDTKKGKKKRSRIRPFKEDWMNKCYKNLIYPNPSCVQVLERVNEALVPRVTLSQGSEIKQQAVFSLLGKEFVTQHFPYNKYNPKALEPPKISEKQKEKYLNEAKEFLTKSLNQAIKDSGYPEDFSNYKEDDELGRYLREIKDSFREGLRQHTTLVIFEEETEKERQDEERKQRKKGKGSRNRSYYSDSDSSNESDNDRNSESDQLNSDDDEKEKPKTKPSEIAGRALVGFMVNDDDSKKRDYANRIRERHLGLSSSSLRQYFYGGYLKQEEAKVLRPKPDQDVFDLAYNNFEKKLTKEMKAQKLSRAIRSNIWRQIDNTVIETYDNTSTLRILDSDAHMIQTARALNILNVHSINFSLSQIFWLLPLQQVFLQLPNEEDEKHVLRLAVYLELVNRHCKPSPKDIFAMADTVLGRLKSADPNYYNHIVKCLSNQVSRINVKDFPYEVLTKDTKASAKLSKDLLKEESKGMKTKDQEIFTDPAIFVRKWLSQGFLGVVSVDAGLWVWDELFLSGWSKFYQERFAFLILALIKPWMMRASMYSGARKVLLEEPGKLYLSDIRKGVAHLEAEGSYETIPDNKNYLTPKPPGEKKKQAQEKPVDKRRNPPRRSPSPPKRTPRAPAPILPLALGQQFNIDINLDSDDSDDEPLPLPEPPPDTESEPEPEPEPEPTPPPTPPPPPPPPEHWAWLPHDEGKNFNHPPPTRLAEPCDFYIDSVRFLPDYVSHCKVTGRFINMYMSKEEKLPDLEAFPLLHSSTRCPQFRFRMRLNDDRVFLNPDMIIILRVYGYQNHTKEAVVVGSCLIRVFDSKKSPPVLCVGGYQKRVRHGLPNPVGGLTSLVPSDMDGNDPIPGTSICVRLLPASQDFVTAPSYETGYYWSKECEPTESERNLFKHYVHMEGYKTDVIGDHLRRILRSLSKKELPDGPELDKLVTRYMESTLDQKAQQNKTKAQIPNIDYVHFVKYDVKIGLKAAVLGVFGLSLQYEGKYCHAYCEVMPGRDSSHNASDHDQRFITKKNDFLSAQRSPQWIDNAKTLYPHYDERSILLVRIFGISPVYYPGDGKSPGKLTDENGERFYLDFRHPIGWGVVQLFEQGTVINGVHWVPLLKGEPDEATLELLYKATPAHKVLLLASKKGYLRFYENTSLEVKLMDGHLDLWERIRDGRQEIQVETLGASEKYVKAHSQSFPHSLDEFVLKNMDSHQKKDGPLGEKFDNERGYFEKEVNYAFFDAMNAALKYVGKKELPP